MQLEDNYFTILCCCFFFSNHHYESTIRIHVSPPSWKTLPLPSPPCPSRLSQSTHLGALCHTSNSHWLSILHMVIYVSILFSQIMPRSLSPTEPKVCSLPLKYTYFKYKINIYALSKYSLSYANLGTVKDYVLKWTEWNWKYWFGSQPGDKTRN